MTIDIIKFLDMEVLYCNIIFSQIIWRKGDKYQIYTVSIAEKYSVYINQIFLTT